AHQRGISPGTHLIEVRINERVLLIVNESLEVLLRKMIQSGREDEAACRAAMVVDGDSGDLEWVIPVNLTAFVKIDETIECCQSATALARCLLGANRLKSRAHRGLPNARNYREARRIASLESQSAVD